MFADDLCSLHALERDAEAVGELRNVLQQLIDHGQVCVPGVGCLWPVWDPPL